jgi:23S rRNA pseudouridine2605 synthase
VTRINKYLAHATGISRREADAAITAGRVFINGKRADLGSQVEEGQEVTFDRKAVKPQKSYSYILLNKPVGYLCSRRSQGGVPTIYSLLPEQLRLLKAVGRLDKDSSGLILLTDDGDFAHRMTHPSFHKTKIYEVQLDKPLAPLHQQMISDYGIQLEDGVSKFIVEKQISQIYDKRVARGGAAPTETKSVDFVEDGADRATAYVPQARNFTVENKFSPEDSLADSHRLSSPASSDLRSEAYDGSGEDNNVNSGTEIAETYQITMSEGRNRQIRRTFAALGYTVTTLHRTNFGIYSLRDLSPGKYISTTPQKDIRATIKNPL